MPDSVGTALIAAGAALAGSGATGFITLRGIYLKSNSDRADLMARLNHETIAARESREQERRQRAYIALLTHIGMLRSFMNINFRVVEREFNAVKAVRDEEGNSQTRSVAEKAALDAAGPTDEEKKEALAAEPTAKERAETVALVYALASDQVRKQFDVVNRTDNEAREQMRNIRFTLRRSGSSESSAVVEAKNPATRKALAKLDSAFDALSDGVGTLGGFVKISDALKRCNKAVDALEEMVRVELRSSLAVVDRSRGAPQQIESGRS